MSARVGGVRRITITLRYNDPKLERGGKDKDNKEGGVRLTGDRSQKHYILLFEHFIK
jgi:hypothetical protein